MHDDDDDLPPELPVLYRTLSATYRDPYTGEPSDIDPSSKACSPSEKQARETAVLRDLPQSGYADAIREKRHQPIMFFGSCKDQAFSTNQKPDEDNDKGGFGLPICAN